jgi:CRISPR-associated endonuclease Cas1 subtype II
MSSMVIRNDEDVQRIYLDEISMLIIENTAISITGCLLSELATRKIKVVFCDEKRNPACELVPYYGSHDCSRKIEKQIEWNKTLKDIIWSEIVAEKIRKQAECLNVFDKHKEAEMLRIYISEIEVGDTTNREGHSAKVYFNALFGMEFTRTADNVTNASLNYGYSIILSAFNREIASNGYLTQLGLFHKNMFNQFNLSCDLMEPFRVLIDRIVKENNFKIFESEQKHILINVLNQQVIYDGTKQYVNNAIKLYCKSVFDALNENDISLIRFYENEL